MHQPLMHQPSTINHQPSTINTYKSTLPSTMAWTREFGNAAAAAAAAAAVDKSSKVKTRQVKSSQTITRTGCE